MDTLTTDSPSRPWQRSALRLGLLLTQAGLLLAALALLPRWWPRFVGRLTFPYPNDGLEGTLLHEAWLVAAGEPLYRPLTPSEFVSAPYPPINCLAVALLQRIGAQTSIFLGGRLVSALAAAAIGLLIIVIVRLVTRSVLGGLLGTALFLSAPPVLVWATRIKPDMLAIALALGGLACVLTALPARGGGAPRLRPLLWAALLFTLALFTRQTTLAAAAAAGLGLWLRDILAWRAGERTDMIGGLPLRRQTLSFGGLALGLIAAGWLGLEALTGGAYGVHVLGLHRSEWWSMLLVGRYLSHLWPLLPAIPLGLGVLLQARHNPRALVLACYLGIAPFTILGAAEISANHNHVLESVLAACLACGAAVGGLWPGSGDGRARAGQIGLLVATVALAAGQVWLAYQPQQFFTGGLRVRETPERFVEFIRSTPGEVLADDVGLLLVAGKPVRYNDPSTQGPAAFSGVWDAAELIAQIRAGAFGAILIGEDIARPPSDGVGRWTEPMRQAIRARYQLASRDKLFVYVPR